MMTNDRDELREFTEELAKFIVSQKTTTDPMVMGAALMKIAMEMYTHTLDDYAIHSLLCVVAESIPEIREKGLAMLNENTSVH